MLSSSMIEEGSQDGFVLMLSTSKIVEVSQACFVSARHIGCISAWINRERNRDRDGGRDGDGHGAGDHEGDSEKGGRQTGK